VEREGAPGRAERQELILSVIQEKPIHTQQELLAELGRRGLRLTQATLSRELKSLGVAKGPDGRGGYRYLAGVSTGEGLLAAMASFVTGVARAENLLVVKTSRGNASGVGEAIDRESWSEILGSIAGDDTILLICPDAAQAARVEKRLQLIAGGRG
jgi:transcriptional regulator of arginine metabolism